MTTVDWFFVICALLGHAWITSKFLSILMDSHALKIQMAHDHAENAHQKIDQHIRAHGK